MNLNPGDVLGKYPHQLSGGQLQRMLIARALLLDIRLLVADEIISMLDASTRIDVLNLLGDLKSRGLGILFITHDLVARQLHRDRTVILRRGGVVEMRRDRARLRQPAAPVHADAARVGAAAAHEVEGRRRPTRHRRATPRRLEHAPTARSSRSRTTTSSVADEAASMTSSRRHVARSEAVRPDPVGGAARPATRDVVWRSSRNPIIPRDLIPRANSIFNSAVVPFGDGFAGVFRVDDTGA